MLSYHVGFNGRGNDQSVMLPVDGDVVGGVVDDVDDEGVALAHLHRRPRELPVRRHDAHTAVAQPLHRRLLDLHARTQRDQFKVAH